MWGPLPPAPLRPRPGAVLAPAGSLRRLVIGIGRATAAAVGVRRRRVAVAPLGVHQLRELKAMQSKAWPGQPGRRIKRDRTERNPSPNARQFLGIAIHSSSHGIFFLCLVLFLSRTRKKARIVGASRKAQSFGVLAVHYIGEFNE